MSECRCDYDDEDSTFPPEFGCPVHSPEAREAARNAGGGR